MVPEPAPVPTRRPLAAGSAASATAERTIIADAATPAICAARAIARRPRASRSMESPTRRAVRCVCGHLRRRDRPDVDDAGLAQHRPVTNHQWRAYLTDSWAVSVALQMFQSLLLQLRNNGESPLANNMLALRAAASRFSDAL